MGGPNEFKPLDTDNDPDLIDIEYDDDDDDLEDLPRMDLDPDEYYDEDY